MQPGKRVSDEAPLVYIKAAHAASKGEYGWPRIWQELRADGIRAGKERVRKLMKLHGVKARGKRKFVVATDGKHDLPVAPSLPDRNFQPDAPNSVWASDVTYIQTDEDWLYLMEPLAIPLGWQKTPTKWLVMAAVPDLYSRQAAGWSMQAHMQTSLVADALRMAWFRRRSGPELIFHSDRGSHNQ